MTVLFAVVWVTYLVVGIDPVFTRTIDWGWPADHFLTWAPLFTLALVFWPVYLLGSWVWGRCR